VNGRVILTADEMRAAEARAVAAGTPVETLMERAGLAAAEAVWRFAGPLPALVLCGPGNNGGDGYVIARALRERGMEVSVAALADPVTAAASAARRAWGGPVAALEEAESAPLLVDALFGTGLRRPLETAVEDRLRRLAAAAKVRVAVDLPSGSATDDGALLSPVPGFDLTVTFATLKPSHLLQPAAGRMGRIVVADIGVEAESRLVAVRRPKLATPGPEDHKYSRGFVLVVAGEMPGAAALTASGALRGGAGYVLLAGGTGAVPHAVVRRPATALAELLRDGRIGAVVVGPGLGRGPEAWETLEQVMGAAHPVVLDGDAFALIAANGWPWQRRAVTLATPHAGEFEAAFGHTGSKIEAARAAAARVGAVLVYKGPDTVVAAPGGRAGIHATTTHWLATAGTGDVLAGLVAARVAARMEPFEAACAAVWLHARAAELAGAGFIADDLLDSLPAALSECL
jgi:hydroxyethylthiazole kinase-like uncharacterized protein yjeF